MKKIDKHIWWVLLLLLIFIAVIAIYIGNKPGTQAVLDQYQQQNQEILNP